MAVNIADLAVELSTDPLGRGYSGMTDQQAADDLNTLYRDAPAPPGALFNYLITETARDAASEPVASTLYGRLLRVDEAGSAGIGQETFVGQQTPGPFSNLTAQGLDACRAMIAIADQDRLGSLTQIMTEATFVQLLTWIEDVGVWKPADSLAIQGLSQNQQSRAQELEMSIVKAAHVAEARA